MTTQTGVSRKSRRWLVPTVAVLAAIACGVAGFLFWTGRVRVPTNGPITVEVARAVVAGDWAGVARLLEPVNDKTESPVARILKAHALLATNRNNESQCLFLGASTPQAQDAWLAWAQEFVRLNPKRGTARFFLGDAFARKGQWGLSAQEFVASTKALEQAGMPATSIAASLNATAAMRANDGHPDLALFDLEKGLRLGVSLADLYANRGALALNQGEARLEEVIGWFSKAIAASPNHLLARYGRAIAHLRQLQNATWPESLKEDVVAVADSTTNSCLPQTFRDTLQASVQAWAERAGQVALAATPEEGNREAGTNVSSAANMVVEHANRWAVADKNSQDAMRVMQSKNANPLDKAGAVGKWASSELAKGMETAGAKRDQGYLERSAVDNPQHKDVASKAIDRAAKIAPAMEAAAARSIDNNASSFRDKAAGIRGQKFEEQFKAHGSADVALGRGLGVGVPGVKGGNLAASADYSRTTSGSMTPKADRLDSKAEKMEMGGQLRNGGAEAKLHEATSRGNQGSQAGVYGLLYGQL